MWFVLKLSSDIVSYRSDYRKEMLQNELRVLREKDKDKDKNIKILKSVKEEFILTTMKYI